MHLVSAEHLRLFALQLARTRAHHDHHEQHAPGKKQRLAAIEPCDVPLIEPRNDMEELLHALGCLAPSERG